MKKGKKGYSLIEVLAAFAIISIAILPIMSMYPAIFKQNKSATEMEEASRIALTIVDYIKARGYTNLNTLLATDFSEVYGLTGATGAVNGGSFQIENNQLDTDLGFTSGVIFLNFKGLNFRNDEDRINDEVRIAVVMARTNVTINDSNYVDPASAATTTTAIMYGGNTPKFIAGRVVIGWGRVNNETQQGADKTLVKREKAYGVDFIVTPKLEE